ncbi:DUF3318 domain-containing protein [Thermocoleostomius sinensis]|uniref:DUF3318 domain-containing protein n=1 Tax=Thermocoleostomius sinensis A174 TaxID=2016057 RepID=A0A9E8ZBE9_9CYAN|nr:DUF3318 domain-containing protein [Thermocoleostomius sinensis]WAL60129.1 DUF3318 domain-containing protein [Thermocoleostomius sinensis A174]
MNTVSEIDRLLDLMPASGRMWTKLVSAPNQSQVIAAKFPLPRSQVRAITINFDLWEKLPQPQRDLLLLHTVCWLIGIRWFKVGLYEGLAAVGLSGMAVELLLGDVAGIVTAGGLTVVAISRIWRKNRGVQPLQDADEAAIAVAKRRGYDEADAVRHLLAGIESVAQLEGRSLSVTELMRSQHLRSLTGPLPVDLI